MGTLTLKGLESAVETSRGGECAWGRLVSEIRGGDKLLSRSAVGTLALLVEEELTGERLGHEIPDIAQRVDLVQGDGRPRTR